MELQIDDKQRKLLLETLATAHMVEYLKGKDNSELEKLIAEVARVLEKEGKKNIFDSVFKEARQQNS